MAKMAEIDGEETEISAAQINASFGGLRKLSSTRSSNCETTDDLLKRQTRREPDADLWSAIETTDRRGKPLRRSARNRLLCSACLLVVYKLLEILPERDLGLAFKLVPLVLIVALFLFF